MKRLEGDSSGVGIRVRILVGLGTMKAVASVLTIATLLLVGPGCDPRSTNTNPDSASTHESNEGEIPGLPFDTGPSSNLTADQAIQIAVKAADIAARVVAAIVPLRDLQAALESGLPLTGCPLIGAELVSTNTLRISLNYSNDCRSSGIFPEVTFEGRVDGLFYPARYEFSLSFEDAIINGAPVLGTIAGSLNAAVRTVAFRVTIDAIMGGERLRGPLTVAFSSDVGEFVLDADALWLGSEGQPGSLLTLTDVRIVAPSNSDLLPSKGVAHVSVPDLESASPGITVDFAEVMFPSQ